MADIHHCPDRVAALAFITHAQADATTATAYLGDEPDGVEAELDGLAQPWLETLRVVVEGGRIVAASAVEWDEVASMAWVQGPWADDPGRFADLGDELLRAAVDQCPPGIRRYEFSGDVANVAMGTLAERLGWAATPVSHVMSVSAADAANWPVADGVRAATTFDQAVIATLHDAEFPAAYATAPQLLTAYTTVVVELDGQVAGYASGELQDDGQVYVDFMVVDPGARGRGLGRGLLGALARNLIASGSPQRLHLTVQEGREPALRLYETLGMVKEGSIRGYRWMPTN